MDLTILQALVLGIIQGVAEWLPISSSGMTSLVLANFYNITFPEILIRTSLFLHLGTFLAALIYFRKEVLEIFKTLFNYKKSSKEQRNIFKFLFVSTLISGILGLGILFLLNSIDLEFTGKTITFAIALLLLFTGTIQLKQKKPAERNLRSEKELTNSDGVVAGFAQGLASLPGISRSGITLSSLLLKKINDTSALRLSFLMSLPIVLLGNIVLGIEDFIFAPNMIYALAASFVFGILTIHGMMKISKRINFGWFVLIFALLMLLGILVV